MPRGSGIRSGWAALLLLSSSMTGCRAPSARQATVDRTEHLQNVRFGSTPDRLLLTKCRGGAPETCSLVIADIGGRTATGYALADGTSIRDVSASGDDVMAVVVERDDDAHGNHASSIVLLSPSRGTTTTLYRDPAQVRFPTRSDGELTFWRRTCRARTDRYCEHDLFRADRSGGLAAMGRRHAFAEVDEIVVLDDGIVVNAGYPADGVAEGDRYLEYAGATTAWRPDGRATFGLRRLAADVDVMKAMAVPGGMLLLGQDARGIGLFRDAGGRRERLVGLPDATQDMQSIMVRDVTASPDGRRVAMIVAGSPNGHADTFVLDIATRTWRRIDPAALEVHRSRMVKPD